MRILIVTPWFPLEDHAGSGIFNLRDAELLGADHEVTVLHLVRPDWYERAEDRTPSGIRVRRVPYLASAPGTWGGARRAIREELLRADALHSMAFPALLPLATVRVAVPWVHTEHWSGVGEAGSGPSGLVGRLTGRLLKRPDRVVAVSESLADAIAVRVHRRPVIIGNAVELPPEGLTASSPLPGTPVRLIGVGGLHAGKGPLLAVEAIARLRSGGVPAELRWAGVGEQSDEVAALAASLGLAESVTLLGHLDRDELEAELLAAHVFVLPTAGETFGVAIAEALACGLPVVATGVGGHVAMAEEFPSAKIVERDPESIASAVRELASSPPEAPGATAARARARFSEEARRAQYATVYEELTDSRS